MKRKNASWALKFLGNAVIVYVVGVGPYEYAQFHDSRYENYRWVYTPVDYVGEQSSFKIMYYRYLSFWTAESTLDIRSRKAPWSSFALSPEARMIENSLGVEYPETD